MKDFAGRVAVVTGAGRGIGLALVEAMAGRGMRVLLTDVAAAGPEEAAQRLAASGAEVVGAVCDVTDASQVDRLADHTLGTFGRVDVLCNNAGVVTGGRTWELSLAAWHRVLDVNLWGVIHGIRAFVPHILTNANGGHVVNVASLASVTPVAGIAPYNVSKHGVLAISETLQADLRAAGSAVGVTVVMPGRVATGIGLASGEPAPEIGEDDEPGIMSPEAVATRIMTAVEDDRLYLFTHAERMEDVAARFARIVEGGAP
jgi:NAD(P)-dependent dehydrogenase (short-subunit alcohol dehydrogenase family)